jgi:hypothetical protein
LGAKKGKAEDIMIKDPKDQWLRSIEFLRLLLPCASHNFYENVMIVEEVSCAVRKLMTEVRDNTLKY